MEEQEGIELGGLPNDDKIFPPIFLFFFFFFLNSFSLLTFFIFQHSSFFVCVHILIVLNLDNFFF